MKTIRIYTLIALAALFSSCTKTEEAVDPYAIGSKQHHYFDSPQEITALSGAKFNVYGWMIEDVQKDVKKMNVLRLLCKWAPNTPEEKSKVTPFTVLVDGYTLSPEGSYPLWANIAPIDSDKTEGIKPFIITESYMPAQWSETEIHFQGLKPSTLRIRRF